jgi:hypothetical protein
MFLSDDFHKKMEGVFRERGSINIQKKQSNAIYILFFHKMM